MQRGQVIVPFMSVLDAITSYSAHSVASRAGALTRLSLE